VRRCADRDDIGISNLSCYRDGLMRYRTPNIDRIAQEGARFTDYYGEQSCTAGRAAFIGGQNPIRTGLTKVGMPGAARGVPRVPPALRPAWRAALLGGQGRQPADRGHGPLTRKRMETVDDEFFAAASVFIRDKADAEQPFFVWFNATHMHFRTHVKPESRGQAGRRQSDYHDTMIDHDRLVGDLLGCSTSSASPRTRSSSTRPTTGRT
jgi:arylsulfatase A-like enzyme